MGQFGNIIDVKITQKTYFLKDFISRKFLKKVTDMFDLRQGFSTMLDPCTPFAICENLILPPFQDCLFQKMHSK